MTHIKFQILIGLTIILISLLSSCYYVDIHEDVLIRVVISTSGFAGLVHENLIITGTGAFTVSGGDQVETFAPGEHFHVGDASRLYISPVDPAHRLEIVGLMRNWPGGQTPLYRGVFEITAACSGFIIVNELKLEEYLYSVVPSEMPSSFGVPASKVQAVTARSFAYHQMHTQPFRAYGAHVADSIFSQVYNNLPENDTSIAAVNATRGQILTYNGEIVLANYFSTSGGTTANFGEVWARGGEFPSHTPTYLTAAPQFCIDEYNPGDLRVEKYADAFLRSTCVPGFDRESPWFRWQVRLTAAQLSLATSLEQLQAIEIIRRGQGGNIMEIRLTGTDDIAYVKTEFNIRTLLAPHSVPVTRHDGSYVSNLTMLPSAFFTIEKETDADGNLAAITFYGGGHGHGVGMSQNGAVALLNRGFTYLQVLEHYYPGTQVSLISPRVSSPVDLQKNE